MTGLNESTVRVHLFRAIRKLRDLLAETATGAGSAVKGNAVSILNRLRLAAIWTMRRSPRSGPTARSTAASVASASRRVNRCRTRFNLFSDGWTNFAPSCAPRRTAASRRSSGGPAGADLPSPRSARTPGPRHRVPAGRARGHRRPLACPPLDDCGRSRRPRRRHRPRPDAGSPAHRTRRSAGARPGAPVRAAAARPAIEHARRVGADQRRRRRNPRPMSTPPLVPAGRGSAGAAIEEMTPHAREPADV